MRLTIAMRASITYDQVKKKYYDKLRDARIGVFKEANKLAEKHLDIDIPPQLQDYIKRANSVSFVFDEDLPRNILVSDELNPRIGRRVGDSERKLILELSDYYPRKIFGNSPIEASKTLKNKIDNFSEIRNEANDFRKKLRNFLNSCTTSKQVKENVPELGKYFKDDEKAKGMALVPAEQIKEIRQAVTA